ncbi:YwiC-like family protein [Arcanobacterium hippocoleae]
MPSSMPKKRRKSLRSLSALGWFPNYHGAWAMITIPILLGTFYDGLAGFRWQHFALWIFWWAGYFAFFAGMLCLKTRFRRGKKPLIIYGVISAGSGLLVLSAHLYLLIWVPVFAPLIGITIWAAWNRRERGIANDLATVTAACLMLPVSAQLGVNSSNPGSLSAQIWISAAIVTGYFLGTVFYVKTNIRERKSNGWLAASIVFHALSFTLTCTLLIAFDSVTIFSTVLILIWLLILFRAICVPIYSRRRCYLSAKTIGFGEFAISLALFIALLCYL